MDIRSHLLTLPFVAQRADGTLNFWSVQPTGQTERDLKIGRCKAAYFVHAMKDLDAPNLLHHVMSAWNDIPAEQRPESYDIRRGFARLLGECILAAPEEAFSGEIISPMTLPANADRDDVLLTIPGAYRDAEKEVQFRPMARAGVDAVENQASGRYLSMVIMDRMRRIEDPTLLWAIRAGGAKAWAEAADATASGLMDVLIGANQALAEVVMSCGRRDHVMLEATWPLHRERVGGPVEPALAQITRAA